MMYIASPLIPTAFIDVKGWRQTKTTEVTCPDKTVMGVIEIEEFDDLVLACRTNFYCNATAVDRVMWDGYTRAGVVIVHCEVKPKIGTYIKARLRAFFNRFLEKVKP